MTASIENILGASRTFSVGFYAELVNVSYNTVLRWVQDEPGVVVISENEKPKNGKRTRRELRVPLSVFVKVYERRGGKFVA